MKPPIAENQKNALVTEAAWPVIFRVRSSRRSGRCWGKHVVRPSQRRLPSMKNFAQCCICCARADGEARPTLKAPACGSRPGIQKSDEKPERNPRETGAHGMQHPKLAHASRQSPPSGGLPTHGTLEIPEIRSARYPHWSAQGVHLRHPEWRW